MEKLKFKQKTQWLPADLDTPISIYMKLVGQKDGILLESAEVDGRWGRYSILAYNMLLYISCKDGNLHLDIKHDSLGSLRRLSGKPFLGALKDMLNHIEIIREGNNQNLPPITRALYGYFGFEMAAIFNPVLQKHIPPQEAECYLAFPASVLVFDHLYNRLCRLDLELEQEEITVQSEPVPTEEDKFPDLDKLQSKPDAQGYKDFVQNIKERLTNGEAIQIVPSTRFSVPFAGNPFNLYRNLRRYNASPYMFYMRFPHLTLFGSSPEVMVRCSENILQLSPIAGTRRRGKNDQEHNELAAELLADPKERAEHVMLVDLGRNDLGKVAKTGTVVVEKSMEVERFSHVMHLTSSVVAILDTDDKKYDAVDVLAASFPAGTVSGAPKIRAIEIIRELEKEARGPYAGCIGWIGLDKDSVNMDFGITIRSMWLGNGILQWQTGGGIVHDSNPDLEWKEVCNKSAIINLAVSREEDSYVPINR